ECSIQRRNQKVIEEAPSPFLDEPTRKAMGEQSVALAQAVDYCSAGTVEFIVDGDRNFYFLEMNTRLQVEHPVTELITGVDLVEQMIRVAAGEKLPFAQADIELKGWALESRLYAEDPYRGFLPSIGRLTRYRPPAETEGYRPGLRPEAPVVRNDTGFYEGGEISRFYDPMIAKLCTWGADRAEAIETMRVALDSFEVEGIGHNLPFVAAVYDHAKFISGDISTAFIAEEYPDGFSGPILPKTVLKEIAVAASWMMFSRERRSSAISGTIRPFDDVAFRRSAYSRAISLAGEEYLVRGFFDEDADGSGPAWRADVEGEAYGFLSLEDWPRDPVAVLERDEGGPLVLKVDPLNEGFRVRYRGADLDVVVRSPRAAELAALMPVKEAADTSKMLLCPMPGVVVSLAVAEGDAVEEGQALATIEAMKMENVLRAEKKGTVAKINAEPGASLAVDDVIMEFE
ncbi:MAG: DUF2118 domain-containing protein, partial [Pseudomonadota bacterium]